MSRRTEFILLVFLVLALSHSVTGTQHLHPRPENSSAVLLPGLGQHYHPIATANPDAQKFFDQGLMMVFGFNRPEAVRSFRRAAELDPQAPMPYWGLALALGRHLNMDVDLDVDPQAAYAAIQKALALSTKGSDYERAYILALAKRCSNDPKANWRQIDLDYKNATGELVQQYPDDLDAAALYAEALMNLHRYQWFDADGKPAEETHEIQQVLESVMRRDSDQPLAHHLYIHLLDTSPHPEYALASAYRLSDLVPGAGHLIHMPSHIFLTLGDYEMTASVNERAAEADRQYMKLTRIGENIYTLVYYTHDVHMVCRARAEQGRFDDARQAAEQIAAHVGPAFNDMPMMKDYYLANPLFVLLRFQHWDDILKTSAPDPKMIMTTAFWHYSRALALAAKGQRKAAIQEKAAFSNARSRIPADWMWMFNSPDKIMNLAAILLEARLAVDENHAIAHWRRAVEAQDALAYDEPPAWYYPVRESLGGALLRVGRAAEAEAVFRENLKRNPRNGRSLFGLMASLKAQKKITDAEWVQKEFESAWKHAQVTLRIEDL